MFKSLVTLALCAQAALAGVYITTPVATTDAIGGQILHVTWQDNGESPSLAEIGPASMDIYTGSMTLQTFLQTLASRVDVSKAPYVNTTIDPSIGPDGAYYFVKVTSLDLKDPNNAQYPYTAYSAKFTIGNMAGQFNATVLAQIDASNSSSVSTSGTASKAATTAVAAVTTVKTTASGSATSTPSSGALASAHISAAALLAFAGAATLFAL